jgi:DNA-binding winged helix-turn-helix (wHTH) protein/tetratricopeptide (TPR) repeat protein
MKEFPPFRLDTVNQCLWRRRTKGADERILLTPKAFAVLHHLVEQAGRLVTHDELLDAVWPNTHIQPQAIKKLVLDLRGALGDQANKPLFIETLHRRGYRFIAAVSEGTAALPAVPAQPARGKLVGRERELSELGDCLGKALRGERQIVFITGEPGIGKTALAEAFQRQAAVEAPGLRIARGQCLEGYGGKEAYYPMLEALGQLCRGTGGDSVVQTLAALAPTWLVQFPALVTREQREVLQREILGATRERMLREICDALETISSQSPLLLVFGDLLWVDPSTVDLISALARRRAPAKLMLVATKRPVDMVIPEHPLKALKQDLLLHQLCREIKLEPLSEAEVAEYLEAESSGDKLTEGLAKLIYHHTEGNPLFVVATLDHLTQQGLVFQERGAWRLRVPLEQVALAAPEKLRRMIEAQIDNLSDEQRQALDVASVAGIAFSARVCAAAAGVDQEDFEDFCEELSRRHHIVRSAGSERSPDGTVSARYEFVHSLYREVFYRRLALRRAARLHQRIGEEMEPLFSNRLSEAAPELAHHFEQASDWQRAVKYLRVAAETARRRFASREAMASFQRALELSSKLPEEKRAVSEIEILEKLGMIYSLEYDRRAIDNYEAMASRAAHLGLIDVEARALVGLAYPLMWITSDRCLKILERALLLSNSESVQLLRASLRMNCFFYRIWAGGWNSQDAEECRIALNEIRDVGDPVTFSYHLAQYSLIQWVSSEYRDAHRNLSGTVSKMLETVEENYLNLSLAVWVYQLFGSSSLLFLGEWGEALREYRSGIAMLDKNGEQYRASALRLYLAWAHLHAMDFEGALKICESSFSHPKNSVLSAESGSSSPLPEDARISLIIQGSAELGLGNYDLALKHLSNARNAMNQHMVIIDWYWRMQCQSSLTELWLAKGDLKQARTEAERFLEVTLATAERTWQALAWEANARVAMAQRDFDRAHECITNAVSTMEGFEVPLAAWRVHATAAELYEGGENREAAEHHRELSRATILKLADSLPAGEPLRKTFLSAPSVRQLLGNGETTNGKRSRSPTKRVKRSAKKSAST